MYQLDLYKIRDSDRWRWRLLSSKGKPVCRTDQSYYSRAGARKAFEELARVLTGRKPQLDFIFSPDKAVWENRERAA